MTPDMLLVFLLTASALWLVARACETGWNRCRKLARDFRALPWLERVFVSFVLTAFCIYGGSKPAAPAGASSGAFSGVTGVPAAAALSSSGTLTPDQYAAGLAHVSTSTNPAAWQAAPSNAVVHAPWTVYGAAEDTFWLPADGWSFVIGTNGVDGLHVSSSGLVSFGNPLSTPLPSSIPEDISVLAPLHGSFGTVPPQGRFWHALTASNSLLLTWENVYAARDTDSPVSFQAELFPDGDFTCRYAFTNAPALTNFFIGARHNGGGETYALNDTDKLADGLELRWRAFGMLDPGEDDHDGDGLSTYDEVMVCGTDPSMPDTDLDGLGDAAEGAAGSNPLLRDTDGDGLTDGSDPDPDSPTSTADLDADGLPDAWETCRFGSTNMTDCADADTNGDGFSDRMNLLAGTDPSGNSAYGAERSAFFIPAPALSNTLATLALAPAFAVTPEAGLTNLVWERGFDFSRSGGALQVFLSSAPDRAAPLRLEGLALEWACGGTGGVYTAFPPDDSLRIPLPAQPDVFTLRLRAASPTATAASRQPLFLLAWTPGVSFPSAVDAEGLPVIVADDPSSIPVSVDRSSRPHRAPPEEPELSATAPFADEEDITFNAEFSTFAAGRTGFFPLPPTVSPLLPPVDAGRTRAAASGGSSCGGLAIISPSLSWSGSSDCGGLGYDADDPETHYGPEYEFPLDSGCIWRDWWTDPSGGGCNCSLVYSLGLPDGCSGAFTAGNGTVYANGVAVWHGEVPPHSHDCGDSPESGTSLLSGPECGCESSCADGGCEGGGSEGDSHGSFQFRIPLGRPAKNRAAGFLWLRAGAPLTLSPASLKVLLSPWYSGAVTVASNANGIASAASPWRAVTVAPVQQGVVITVTDPGAAPYTWTLSNPGGDPARIRAVREKAGNILRDVTYDLSVPGVSARTDSLTGITEALAREDRLNDAEATLTETRTVSDAVRELSRTVTVSKRIGIGPAAVLREVYREERGAYSDNTPRTSYASYREDGANPARNGTARLVTGNDRPWRYTAFDTCGRLVLALDQLDGSLPPDESLAQALDAFADGLPATNGIPDGALADIPAGLPPCTLTLYAYGSVDSADSADPLDDAVPRAESVFVLRDPASGAIPVSSLVRVLTRFETNGLPAVAVTTTRLPPPGVSGTGRTALDVRYADTGVPDALRGLPLLEVTENGVTGTWDYAFGDYDPASRAFTADPDGAFLRTVSASSASPLLEIKVTDAAFGRLFLSETRHAATGDVLSRETREYDSRKRHISSAFSDGTAETNTYDCCRLTAVRSRDGTVTEHWQVPGVPGWCAEAETSIGQLPGADSGFPVTETFRDGLGRVTNTVRCVWKDGARDPAFAPLETRTAYPRGVCDYRVTIDPFDVQTSIRSSYPDHEIEEIYSGGVTNWIRRYRGGATATEKRWDGKWTYETRSHAFDAEGRRVETVVMTASDILAVTNAVTTYDYLGRAVSVATPLGVTSNFYGGASTRLIRVARTGQPDTLYEYDAFGDLRATAIDVDGDGQISYAGVDRITATHESYEQDASNIWWRVTSRADSVGGVTNALTVSREQLTGLSPALLSRTVTIDANAQTTTVTRAFEPGTDIIAETSQTGTAAPRVRRTLYGRELENAGPDAATLLAYDGLGRAVSRTVTNAAGTVSTTAVVYDTLGNAVTNTTTYGCLAAVTATGFDEQGRAVSQTDALGNTVFMAYSSLGQVLGQSGATYPVAYGYDSAGRMTALSTTRDGETWDTTAWLYENATGLLTNKVYADNSRVSYTYTQSGRPLRTTWARGAWKENAYDSLGQLVSIAYSDNTPDVSHAYDVSGHVVASSNSFARYEYANSLSGIATNELVTVGTNTCWLDRRLGVFSRLAALGVCGTDASYGYDGENRLSGIVRPEAETVYRYTNGFVAGYTLTLTNGNVFCRAVGRDPHRQGLCVAVSNFFNGAFMQGAGYGHDLLGHRTGRIDTVPGSSVTNSFGYNERSEVTNAVLGTDNHAYGYDSIGNRVFNAVNAVTNTYSANCLNQYTGFSYDADGNLISGGRHVYSWDSENRLRSATPANATNGSLKVVNRYDHMHRRVTKKVYALSGYTPPYGEPPMPGDPGEWGLVREHTYFYDGWNLVLETVEHADGSTDRIEYVWGLDLSGTLQGAGGVGGLLFEVRNGQIFIPFYDANGNVTSYVDAYGNVRGQYIYDVFGNTVGQTGDLVDTFKFRFSTKYYDAETRSYYYGYRFYSPELMRWLNRDPIGEEGGRNLYGFANNTSINAVDALGLEISIVTKKLFDRTNIKKTADSHSGRGLTEINARVRLSCRNCVFFANGSYEKTMYILAATDKRWRSIRLPQYNKKWGFPRDNNREREATIAHEHDHWKSWQSYEKVLERLNALDGKLLRDCAKQRDTLWEQLRDLERLVRIRSRLFDSPPWDQGGMYEN